MVFRQEAARANSGAAHSQYAPLHNNLVKASFIRGQLDFKPAREPLLVDIVESASESGMRFRTDAMSHGSIFKWRLTPLPSRSVIFDSFSSAREGGKNSARYQPMSNVETL